MSSGGTGIETKVGVGSAVTIVAGYIAWALVTYVPGLKDTFPLDLQGQLPVLVAFALSSVAAYLAPHTHRPDLPPLPVLAPMPVASAWQPVEEPASLPAEVLPGAETGQGGLPAPPKA